MGNREAVNELGNMDVSDVPGNVTDGHDNIDVGDGLDIIGDGLGCNENLGDELECNDNMTARLNESGDKGCGNRGDGHECNNNMANGLNESGDKGCGNVGEGLDCSDRNDSSDNDYKASSESSDEESVSNCS